jgi:hypothetical protein
MKMKAVNHKPMIRLEETIALLGGGGGQSTSLQVYKKASRESCARVCIIIGKLLVEVHMLPIAKLL